MIVAKPINRDLRQVILLCIYLSLSMWTTFAVYSIQVYKYSRDCPQYSDMIILYDSVEDANVILRDEVAMGFQKHRQLIYQMLKENPNMLPHIINFLMNSYGEHIGFDILTEKPRPMPSRQIARIGVENIYDKYLTDASSKNTSAVPRNDVFPSSQTIKAKLSQSVIIKKLDKTATLKVNNEPGKKCAGGNKSSTELCK